MRERDDVWPAPDPRLRVVPSSAPPSGAWPGTGWTAAAPSAHSWPAHAVIADQAPYPPAPGVAGDQPWPPVPVGWHPPRAPVRDSKVVLAIAVPVGMLAAALVASGSLAAATDVSGQGAARDDGQASYAFLETTPAGEPVGYDPCAPIHYVINSEQAPAGGLAIIHEAVAEVEAATGLTFLDAGATTATPSWGPNPTLVPGERGMWAEVLIHWTDEASEPDLAGDVVGLGGSTVLSHGVPGATRYATGSVVLDAVDIAEGLEHTGGRAQVRATVMHELGHVLGLDHVDDPAEVMHPSGTYQTEWGEGDRLGLAAIGAGRCGR